MPEDSPSPAITRRVDGFAQPPEGSTISGPTFNSAAPGGALEVGQALEDARISSEQRGSSRKGGRPPIPTINSTAVKQFPAVGTVFSGDLVVNGRRGCLERGVGIAGVLPGSSSFVLPGNGGHLKPAGILPEDASQALDALPVRDPTVKFHR